MNTLKAKELISLYRKHFDIIHEQEIYKWKAVKCFQDNWNIDAPSFPEMLHSSLQDTYNLLRSVKYYPRGMIWENAEESPEEVRQLFRDLFNEEQDLRERIKNFRANIKIISKRNFPEKKNDYQDHRAVLVYLSLRYPDRYFLYKSGLLKAFAPMVDYPYQIKSGAIENITHYLTLCSLLREEIIKDAELVQLHKTRLSESDYPDNSLHILTQDVIFAAVNYTGKFLNQEKQASALKRLVRVDKTPKSKSEKVVLRGRFTNYIANERENKRIGDLGEILVLEYEQENMKRLSINKEPKHISKSEGDGLGYDILSYDVTGQEIFIEVKTTVGNCDSPFFITQNELERSKQDSNKFYLYRLYEYNDVSRTAKYYTRKGDLSNLCINPVLFKVILTDNKTE